MSLWRYMFDNEWRQRRDIDQAVETLEHTSGTADQAHDLSQQNRQRLDRLELMFEAMYRHLEASGSLTRAQFAALIEQTDLADGNLDGRVGPDVSAKAPKCQACGKPVARRRTSCVYCAAEIPRRR